MDPCNDRYLLRVRIEHLPEGTWMGSSDDLPGLVVEASTRDELLETVPGVAQKVIESYCANGDPLPDVLLERSVSLVGETEGSAEVEEVRIPVAM